MAHRRQRKEDARQQHQHPGRQIHHLRPDGSPPLLSGHDQGEGDSGQEGGHRPRLPGHGGRTDLFPRYSGGLLPDQFGSQVGIPDADLRRGRPARLLLPRFRLLLHPQPTHGPRPHGGHLHARIGREPPHRATSNATSTRATSTPSSRASAPARRANPTFSNRTPSACNGRTRRIRRPTRAPPSPHRSTSPRAVTPNTRPRRSTTFSRRRPTRRSPTRRTGREPLSRSR